MLKLNAKALVQKRQEILSEKFNAEYERILTALEEHFNDDFTLINGLEFNASSSIATVIQKLETELLANGFGVVTTQAINEFQIVVRLPLEEAQEAQEVVAETVIAQPVEVEENVREVKVATSPKVEPAPVPQDIPDTSKPANVMFHGAPF